MIKENNSKKTSPQTAPPASFVKLAMRNMVRKGNQSISHFAFTAFGLIGLIVLIASLGRPNLPH